MRTEPPSPRQPVLAGCASRHVIITSDKAHGRLRRPGRRPPSPPAEELRPGELRALRYLPTNLSRPEIAGELSVSVNTVSTHLRSIYAKLGVGDRSSAVRRARELRLLAAGRTR